MPIRVANRAMETSTTTGTGTLTLSGVAVTGYQTFTGAGANTLTVDYTIEGINADQSLTGEYEVGRGVYTTAGNALTRATVLESSNADALVNLSAGTKRVFITAAAEDLAILQNNNVWTVNQTYTLGTITASAPTTTTVTLNNAGVTFVLESTNVTNTASNSASVHRRWQVGGSNVFEIRLDGAIFSFSGATRCVGMIPWTNGDVILGNTSSNYFRISPFSVASGAPAFIGGASSVYGWVNAGGATNGADTLYGRAAANSIVESATGVAASALNTTRIRKSITAIADNVATATFTVSIPNAAHSASVYVKLTGSLGAGGAIGANEATGSVSYDIAIARTTGVNAVATISAAYGSSSSSVAGGATVTVTGAVSAISGAVGAVNTFTVNITIARGSGASTNHTAHCYAELQNANATGITIS